jgi:hypothetical protein
MAQQSSISLSEVARPGARKGHSQSVDTCSGGPYDGHAHRARDGARVRGRHIPSPRCSLAGTHSQCRAHRTHSPQGFELPS